MSVPRPGNFQFCIDTGLPAHQTAIAQHREMNLLIEQLAGTFARHDVVATWAIAQSVNSPIADIIHAADERHELALLGDGSWLSESIRREEIVQHFAENMRHAADVGKPLRTLVLRAEASESLLPIFKKRGINTLRPMATTEFSRSPQREPALRNNDMWVSESTAVFPARGRLLGRMDIGFRGKQILNRARHKKTTEQLNVVAANMLENPTAALRSLDRVLRFAAKFADHNALNLETLQEASTRWSPVRSVPQRSVLRPAA